jgi:hypothetical protein
MVADSTNAGAAQMKTLRSIALAAVAAFTMGSAQAVYIVDTGPGVTPNWALFVQQSLGATFNVAAAGTINSVEGWIDGSVVGTVTVQLVAGTNPNGAVLYSAGFAAPAAASWQGAGSLGWVVAAGDYTVTFRADSGFAGSMPGAAPNPLVTEWFTLNDQTSWTQYDGLDLGVRIDAGPIPEPGTYALMLLGLAGLGTLLRRRA